MDTRVIRTFFLLAAEYLLVPMYHNSDKTDLDIVDSRLLWTTFPISTAQRTSGAWSNCAYHQSTTSEGC